MEDVVERLRDAVRRFSGQYPAGLMDEAANEIQWLRKSLQEIYDLHHNNREMSEMECNDRTFDIVYVALGKE